MRVKVVIAYIVQLAIMIYTYITDMHVVFAITGICMGLLTIFLIFSHVLYKYQQNKIISEYDRKMEDIINSKE